MLARPPQPCVLALDWYLARVMLRTLAAVFIISASVLAYEVALMRVFVITHWHHLAHLVISGNNVISGNRAGWRAG